MFTSKEYLHLHLGIDAEIAGFFVDRKIPGNNRYWKGKYLYVSSGTGYLFIPVFFDLQYKLGIRKEELLSPLHLSICESILHSAALYEFEELPFAQHIQNCKHLVSPYIKDPKLFKDLSTYFESADLKPYNYLGTFSKPLNRADSFLFALTTLAIPAQVLKMIIEQWYALIPSFLLMDDITDLREDMQRNEENSINDFAPGNLGVEKAIEYLRLKFTYLRMANEKLGEFFQNSLDKKLQTSFMQSMLNS